MTSEASRSAGGGADRPARRAGRRPGTSGTREAIAAAASGLFAERGYDRTSVRSIAAAADVDPALVTHFFGSKAELFVAVVQLPVPPALIIAQVVEGDRRHAGERLARFLLGILEDPRGRATITGIVRAAASEPRAAELVRELITREILTPMAAALGADQPELRAALAGSQIVGLVMARYVVGVPPLAAAPPGVVAAAIAPTLQRYLTAPLAERA